MTRRREAWGQKWVQCNELPNVEFYNAPTEVQS